MGLYQSKIHFEDNIPPFKVIQDHFKKQTGLKLNIIATLNLVELPRDGIHTMEQISSDFEQYKVFKQKNFKGDHQLEDQERAKINHLDYPRFYVPRFYPLNFSIEGNSIILLFGLNRFYFPISLHKVLYDLGGRFLNFQNEIVDNWYEPQQWSKLKQWDDYQWYNRPKK